ncbi:YybH family protein [Goodfellowiella coeruleoviolacea]|uniref:SnoaL-like domain-containing protein n=1 Tax=Goodfellowiella coeruleoviolacea TaxID=334858 RepID=A0AAE3GL01_9PSEU|nr:nuclear transport factor 2 family protein [Goodfellowiella coeruleoviolacea]MCP2169563.1 SnoaL-like domain-containing protein [Goodfellowiella coeruleoviolacea]
MINTSAHSFGPAARNRLDEAVDQGVDGAWAALETFYHAFNQRDLDVFRRVWSDHPLAQLNNPLGGILRGGPAIADLYRRIFHGPARVEVTFGDIVEYVDGGHAVFAGRETGTYTRPDGQVVPLSIRTTRYFRHDPAVGRWLQFHHHGSIDDAAALADYQRAVRG